MSVLAGPTRGDGGCECRACMNAWRNAQDPSEMMIGGSFIVCPICGNKRCPKASNHENACSGSNEPGQAGSDYA